MTVTTITEIVALNERGAVGGRLWLDDTDGRGRVVLLGYDRAWTNCWSARGRGGAPLGPWLADSEIEYLAKRMGANGWYDAEATTAAARRLICRDRRDGCLDSDEARELFEAAEDLGTEGVGARPSASSWGLSDWRGTGSSGATSSPPTTGRRPSASACSWSRAVTVRPFAGPSRRTARGGRRPGGPRRSASTGPSNGQ